MRTALFHAVTSQHTFNLLFRVVTTLPTRNMAAARRHAAFVSQLPTLRSTFIGSRTKATCTISNNPKETLRTRASDGQTKCALVRDNPKRDDKIDDDNSTIGDSQVGEMNDAFQSAVDEAIYSVYPPSTVSSPGVENLSEAQNSTSDGGDSPPTRYDSAALQKYWSARSFELNQRYLAFAQRAAPFGASVLRHVATGTLREDRVISELAVQAREGMEALGPSYVKVGQMMGIRPDIIPAPAMEELQKLQDNVQPFDDAEARKLVEEELGRPISEVFSEFSEKPIAAASLAQVYRARLRDEGTEVAVKVQRPEALTLCSKDMYVLQRAVGVYQNVMKRWTAQKVDYKALLTSFASGFFEELDFANEARNQTEARNAILNSTGGKVYVPKVFHEYSSRRLLVSEFVYGSKLTNCEPKELRRLTEVAQECFLRMLLDRGQRMHCDAHGGNQLKWDRDATIAAQTGIVVEKKGWEMRESSTMVELGLEPELILIDFGLMESIPEDDKPKIIVAIVHMASKDFGAVTQDMIDLGFLPDDVDRARVTALLERILTPYVLEGGGASAFMGENGVFEPSFRNLMKDMSRATLEIPFSIPPFWPVIGRGIAILEGLALAGDPKYKIVLSAYPFVARKLLENSSHEGDKTTFRQALNAILYPVDKDGIQQDRPSTTRILALLNNALGKVVEENNGSGTASFNLDALPAASEDQASLEEMLVLLNTERGEAMREFLVEEITAGCDLLLRSVTRRLASNVVNIRSLPIPGPSLPFLPKPRIPIFNPLAFLPVAATVDKLLPELSTEEEIYATNLVQLAEEVLGIDIRALLQGSLTPQEIIKSLQAAALTSSSGESNEVRTQILNILPSIM